MPIIPYDDFQGRLARERSNGDVIDYELGEDGVYRPVQSLPTTRPTGRPVPRRNPGLGAVGAAVDAVCLARSIAPNQFLRNLVSASPFDVVPGVRNARERAFNFLCDETPNAEVPVQVPFFGGQCDAVPYEVSFTVERFILSGGNCESDLQDTQTVTVWGPITQADFKLESDFGGGCRVRCRGLRNSPIQPGQVEVLFFAAGSSAGCTPPRAAAVNIVRADGLPDGCGDPVIQPVSDNEPIPPNLSLDLTLANNQTINVPIDVSFNPEIGIQIDVGDISINFDGENIEYTEPTDPGAQEEIPRLPPQNTFTQDDRDVINQTFNTVNQGVEVDLQPVLDRIDSLEVFVDGRFDSVDAALACIEELVKQVPCPECSKQFGTQVVGNLLFTLGDTVKYVQVARPGSCFLLVEVESAIPPEVRKYTLTSNPDEVEAGIGSFALTYTVEGGGTQVPDASFHLLNKLSSLIYLPSAQIDGVRFTCKPGIILTVTDLGYVRMVPEITCNPPPGA